MPRWIDTYDYIYEVYVDDANLLQIDNRDELIAFTEEYRHTDQRRAWIDDADTLNINWEKVADKYDGIEINPYIHSCRLSDATRWYYTWDVASGVCWDTWSVKVDIIGLWSDNQRQYVKPLGADMYL
jgi:hypothetical protein